MSGLKLYLLFRSLQLCSLGCGLAVEVASLEYLKENVHSLISIHWVAFLWSVLILDSI